MGKLKVENAHRDQDARSDEGKLPDAPVTWRYASEGWRLAQRLSPRAIDLYLRTRGAQRLPRSFQARFNAMRLPGETINRALSEVRGLGDWMGAWNRAAQRHLGEARREDAATRWQEAAVARRHAAMCYHAAHLITDTDERTVRALRAASVAVFGQALPLLMAQTRRVAVRWRTHELPGYLARANTADGGESPLAVLLNGATTSKEELILWATPFLAAGISVLALDWPGTGEAYALGPVSSHCDDITEGIVALAAAEQGIDSSRLALIGFSLGGAVAIRAAAKDRRIAACVSVSGPYDPGQWISRVNPIVRQQLAGFAGEDTLLGDFAADFSLVDIISRTRCPVLVFGAGRDLVAPPEEAMHLAAAAGDLATLVWYPDGAHGLYEYVDDWTAIAASWVSVMFDASDSGADAASTWMEPEPARADTACADASR